MEAKTVVCPVDFSAASDVALDLASKLARENGAKMYIVHVLENAALMSSGMMAGMPPETREMRNRLNATLPTATEVQFEHDVLTGDPAEKIVEFAQEKGADLIVMASHIPGFLDYVFSSKAGYLALHSNLSVFIVR